MFPTALTGLAVFLVFDTVQLCGTGALKSMGRQEYASKLELVCEVVVGLSIAFFLGIRLEFGIAGLWTGAIAGYGLFGFLELRYIIT